MENYNTAIEGGKQTLNRLENYLKILVNQKNRTI